MGSNRQAVIDFVVLNHDEDLLALLRMEWLADSESMHKNRDVKGLTAARPHATTDGEMGDDALATAGAGHGHRGRLRSA
jgi:hypothetical protein